MKKIFIKNNKKAFTLLFAVLVSSLVLAVGASIIDIATKQVILSGSGRDSEYAFYAANTGAECAIYWDRIGLIDDPNPVFPINAINEIVSDTSLVTCNGFQIIDNSPGCDGIDEDDPDNTDGQNFWCYSNLTADSAETTFRIEFAEGYCANVTVLKHPDPLDGDKLETVISSRGYNTCDPDNHRRVERGLRYTF